MQEMEREGLAIPSTQAKIRSTHTGYLCIPKTVAPPFDREGEGVAIPSRRWRSGSGLQSRSCVSLDSRQRAPCIRKRQREGPSYPCSRVSGTLHMKEMASEEPSLFRGHLFHKGQQGCHDLLFTCQKEGSIHSKDGERQRPSLPGGKRPRMGSSSPCPPPERSGHSLSLSSTPGVGEGIQATNLGRMYPSTRETEGPSIRKKWRQGA